jgi:hypothetical protein
LSIKVFLYLVGVEPGKRVNSYVNAGYQEAEMHMLGGGELTGKAQHAELSCCSLPKNNRLPEGSFHWPSHREAKVGLIRPNAH